MGVPQTGWFNGTSHLEMDDESGYPYDLGNPEIVQSYVDHVQEDLFNQWLVNFQSSNAPRAFPNYSLCGKAWARDLVLCYASNRWGVP